jgi:hypothetical protein
MKKTMNMKKVFALGLTLLALAACDKNEGTSTITSRGTGPRISSANAAGGAYASGVQMQGVVKSDASNQNSFQEAVVGFLSTDVQASYIGYVSATGQYNSGVLIGGRVNLASGSLRTLGGGQSPVASNGRFQIQVIDYNPQYPNAAPIPPFIFTRADGYVSGNSAQITFSDSYGSVMLQGTLDSVSGRFVGQISYDNNVNIEAGQQGAAGTLGDFAIPICSFFVCN